jgi:hypothetical protein
VQYAVSMYVTFATSTAGTLAQHARASVTIIFITVQHTVLRNDLLLPVLCLFFLCMRAQAVQGATHKPICCSESLCRGWHVTWWFDRWCRRCTGPGLCCYQAADSLARPLCCELCRVYIAAYGCIHHFTGHTHVLRSTAAVDSVCCMYDIC